MFKTDSVLNYQGLPCSLKLTIQQTLGKIYHSLGIQSSVSGALYLSKSKDNVVLIGTKPVMNYVVACITFFNSGVDEIIVKARGRTISRAVDCVELLRRAFVKNLTIKGIKIGTEEIERSESRKTSVSTIEILINKQEERDR